MHVLHGFLLDFPAELPARVSGEAPGAQLQVPSKLLSDDRFIPAELVFQLHRDTGPSRGLLSSGPHIPSYMLPPPHLGRRFRFQLDCCEVEPLRSQIQTVVRVHKTASHPTFFVEIFSVHLPGA